MELHPIIEPGDRPLFNLWYVVSSINPPSQRVGHACAFQKENNKFYVLGGADPSGTYDDIYSLDLISQRWTKLTVDNCTKRYEHCSVQPVSAPNKIYVFGGANQSDNLNSMEFFDTATNSCKAVQYEGTPPLPRTMHIAASDGDLLYVWGGGHKGAVPVNDLQLHVFNCSSHSWTKPTVKGKLPSARHGHVMVVIDKILYIHGGMSGSTFHKDMHAINLSDFSCSKVKQRGVLPSSRAAHACCAYEKLLFIFGGMLAGKALDDMYHFYTVNRCWTKLNFESPPPTPRLDHSMVFAQLPYINKSEQTTTTTTSQSPQTSTAEKSEPNIIPIDSWSTSDNGDSKAGVETLNSLSNLNLDSGSTPLDTVPVCIVFGGMDESGNLFDDVLIYRLDSPCVS